VTIRAKLLFFSELPCRTVRNVHFLNNSSQNDNRMPPDEVDQGVHTDQGASGSHLVMRTGMLLIRG
jgi:hypothetical protein